MWPSRSNTSQRPSGETSRDIQVPWSVTKSISRGVARGSRTSHGSVLLKPSLAVRSAVTAAAPQRLIPSELDLRTEHDDARVHEEHRLSVGARRAEIAPDILIGVAVGGVEHGGEPRQARDSDLEILLQSEVQEVPIGDAAVSVDELRTDGRGHSQSRHPDAAAPRTAGLVLESGRRDEAPGELAHELDLGQDGAVADEQPVGVDEVVGVLPEGTGERGLGRGRTSAARPEAPFR